jgi:uncharacterized tellurite resistance protein B-like protein
MEAFAWLFALWLGYVFLKAVFGKKTSTPPLPSAGTANPPATASADYFGPLQLRLGKERLGEGNDARDVAVLEARGILPLRRDGNVVAVTSILDVTDRESPKPVLASMDIFQEPNSACFQSRQPLGRLSIGAGARRWVRLSMVPTELLVPPKRGRRRLSIILRLYDDDLAFEVEYGFADTDAPAFLGGDVLEITHEFKDAGYEDEREAHARIGELAVKLAVAIAAADGEVADAEGFRIREWMRRRVASGGGDQNETKRRLNGAFLEACDAAQAGRLAISDITREVNSIGSMPQKWSCVDLCFEIIAADGLARPEELDLVRRIAKSIGVPPEELEALQDRKLVGVRTELGQTNDLDTVLGLDPSWEAERAQRHLREQFQKWNNRLAALQEGDERDNAQRMLDLIADARKRYV